MSVVDKAPPAATLELMDVNPQTFKMRDGENPCIVSLPGNSSFDLALFDVIAIGTVNPTVPGSLSISLIGRAKDSGELLPLATSLPEPIGSEGELDETMWMIRGKDLMIFTGSGRMQGTFDSNIANHPTAPLDLDHRPGNITDSDPLYVFGVAVTFTPATKLGGKAVDRAAAASCSVTLHSLTVNAE